MGFRNIWQDIKKRRNIDLYLTLIVAFGVLVADLVGLSTERIISNVLLALMGLIALGLLEDRRAREQIVEAVAKMNMGKAVQVFHTWNDGPFRKRIRHGKTLDLLAIANYIFVSQNVQLLADFLKQGGKIRYIIVDPQSQALTSASKIAIDFERDPKYLVVQIELTLQTLKALARNAEPGKVQVKLIPVLPFAIMTSIDGSLDEGEMYVTLNGFEQSPVSRPSFILSQLHDSKWFLFFQDSFERLWTWEEGRVFRVDET